MYKYRSAALVLAACAAAMTLAACSAGASTSSAATSPAASSRGTSAGASARASSGASSGASSLSPGVPARKVAVGGSIGTFPIPAGAEIAENVSISRDVDIIFTLVTPAKVSNFYATELPRAGYVISGNDVASLSGGTEVLIEFSGHGYKGNIAALSDFSGGGVSIAGLGHKNVTTISLQPA
jgi:hypothetical protein